MGQMKLENRDGNYHGWGGDVAPQSAVPRRGRAAAGYNVAATSSWTNASMVSPGL